MRWRLGTDPARPPFQTVIASNISVVACVTAGSPFLSFNTSLNCTTGTGRRVWPRDWQASGCL